MFIILGTPTVNIKYPNFWAFGQKVVKNTQKHPKNAIYCTYKKYQRSKNSRKNAILLPIILNAIFAIFAKIRVNFRKKVSNYCTYKNKNSAKTPNYCTYKNQFPPILPIYCTYKNTKMNYCTYRKYPFRPIFTNYCTYKNRISQQMSELLYVQK